MLEFALVFVLFAFLVYGLIAYGMILATKQRVTNAAADGARSAVGAANWPDAKTRAEQRIHDALGPETAYTAQITNGLCNPVNPLSPSCITVELTYHYGDHPIVPVPEFPGLHLFTPDTFGSKAVVQWSV